MNARKLHLRRAVAAGILRLLAGAALPGALAADRAPAPAPSAAPATHVLFMGADLYAPGAGRVFHPIVDVTAASLVVQADAGSVKLPLAAVSNLRIDDALKLSATDIALDELKAERAYSADADPATQLARTAALAGGQSAEVDLANASLRVAGLQVAGAGAALNQAANPQDAADAARALGAAQGNYAQAESALNRALAARGGQVYDVGAQAGRFGEEAFDAIRVTFVLTPETALTRPYYGVIARLRDPDGRSGPPRQWVYLQPLGPLAAGAARRVTVFQSGFPPGYTLEACEVHVYENGEEIATTLSRRRVPLSDDEAMEYRVIDYVGRHKGRTLPAALATTTLATATWATIPRAQLAATQHVRVARDGRVIAAYADEAGRKPLPDAELVAVLKSLRFYPALEAGKAVESMAAVSLGGLEVR